MRDLFQGESMEELRALQELQGKSKRKAEKEISWELDLYMKEREKWVSAMERAGIVTIERKDK